MKRRFVASLVIVLALVTITSVGGVVAAVEAKKKTNDCDQATTVCQIETLAALPAALDGIKVPDVATPAWMQPKDTPTGGTRPITKTVNYTVQTRGQTKSSLAEFKQLANETLNDARGWRRLGVKFVEVATGGSFILTLATPSEVGAVPGCSNLYSCRSGSYVLINETPWTETTPSWTNAGGSLRDYRHMVVNHETGHWLGHDHQHCGGAGQAAPVMQQQSIDLEGCRFNPWPATSELWSTTLGIAL